MKLSNETKKEIIKSIKSGKFSYWRICAICEFKLTYKNYKREGEPYIGFETGCNCSPYFKGNHVAKNDDEIFKFFEKFESKELTKLIEGR